MEILERFYGLVLTDCGTGLLHSAMSSVLAKADVLVVVSSGSIDGARSASATLDWLDAHGHEDLVRNSVAVINAVRPRTGKVDMQKVIDHFARRCRAVRLVPFDPHLEEGAEISLDRLRRPTREALTELAAVVADGFPGRPPRSDPEPQRGSLCPRVLSRRKKSGSSSGPITRVWPGWPVTALRASRRRSASPAPGPGAGRALDTSLERIYPRRRLDPVSEGPSGNSAGTRQCGWGVGSMSTSCFTRRPGCCWWSRSAARSTGWRDCWGSANSRIVVAVLFALIIAMPLGIWLFAPLRRRATAALAVSRRTPAPGT